MVQNLPLPEYPHGQRLLITCIDQNAKNKPNDPWVSICVDDNDLTKGYKYITWSQFSNAINHAAGWLKQNLPASAFSKPFQSFGYVGPKDIRYPIFAVAAGKLGLVVVLPSSSVTPFARTRILEQKETKIFLHAAESSNDVKEVVAIESSITPITVPELSSLLTDELAEVVPYTKSFEQGKDDPWLCFHTSGTTGYPKVITYSQIMLSSSDIALGLVGAKPSMYSSFINSCILIPMPFLHYVGMVIVLAATTFMNSVPTLLPPTKPPTPETMKTILSREPVDSVILVPIIIDALCADAEALALLRGLKYVCYAGAPLSKTSAQLLTPYVAVLPAIGSTDAGGYYYELVNENSPDDYDYVTFQPHAGAVMEPRVDDMYELVFVKNPKCVMQPVFKAYPDIDKFYTKDLWVEHPTKKNQWKIVGRTDDYLFVQNGDGLYVATLEPILEEDSNIKSALLVGQGRPVPLILVELNDSAQHKAETESGKHELLASLRPFVDRANELCHKMVKLDPDLVVFADADRPFPRTVKDTVSRIAAARKYEKEIDEAYQRCGYVDVPRI